jgi:hypothetical protein
MLYPSQARIENDAPDTEVRNVVISIDLMMHYIKTHGPDSVTGKALIQICLASGFTPKIDQRQDSMPFLLGHVRAQEGCQHR